MQVGLYLSVLLVSFRIVWIWFICLNTDTHWHAVVKTIMESTFSNYQLIVQLLYSSTICMLHYNPQHVSSSTPLILRRTNCITTASGIVTLCKRPYSMQVESGLQSQPAYCTAVYREWRYQRLWWYNLSSWG